MNSTQGTEGGGKPRKRPRRPFLEERRSRAFQAYFDLMDTADWMRKVVRGQLEILEVSLEGFRVLELLRGRGPMSLPALSEARGCKRQTMFEHVRKLVSEGRVTYEVSRHAPVRMEEKRIPSQRRGLPRQGKLEGMVRLSPQGEKFMRAAVPRHRKLVYAFMLALGGREHETLSRICRKLRDGDIFRFLKEMEMVG
jgi:DNA-binding MarR family transcriptional regulator